jgi:hypothetical protein
MSLKHYSFDRPRCARRLQRKSIPQIDALEPRQLLDSALSETLSDFNAGLSALHNNLARLTAAADRDLGNVPLIRDQPMTALQVARQLDLALPRPVLVSDDLAADLADLKAKKLAVDYLSTVPDASGNFLVARLNINRSNVPIKGVVVGGAEGFAYLDQAKGSLSGTLSGSLQRLTGSLTLVVNASGLEIRGADSSIAGRFQLSGRVSGIEEVGYLQGVSLDGTTTLGGTVNLHFATDSGLILPRNLGLDRLVVGAITGSLSYNPKMQASLGGSIHLAWAGSFGGTLTNQRVVTGTSFVPPRYQDILGQLHLTLIDKIKSLPWFQELEPFLEQKIPLLNKSIAEITGIDNKVGDGLAILGISTLNSAQGQAAMDRVIQGQLVDLVRYDHSGSIKLLDGNLGPSIPLDHVEIIPGILSGDVSTYLTGALSLGYDIHVGVDTRGLYFTPQSNLSVNGSIEGGLKGTLTLAHWWDFAEASGGLSLDTTIAASFADPDKDGHVYQSEIDHNPLNSLVATIDVDLKGKVKAKVDTILFGEKTVFSKSFELLNVVHASFGPAATPPDGNKPALVFEDTLDGEPDRLTVPPPVAPANLTPANVWARTVDLHWDDRSDNEDSFEVYMSPDGGTSWRDVGGAAANATSFRVANLNPATVYEFMVKAVNGAAPSDPSNVLSVTTPDEAPRAPSNVRAANVWALTIDLNWDDNSNNETEFRVAISRDGGATWDNAGVAGANQTSLRVDGLNPATRYLFMVRAVNAAGYSDYSSVLDVTTPDEAPTSPNNLRAANVWARTIDLNWDDNSNNETEFRVAISRDGGATWDNADVVGANQTSLRVDGLNPATRYLFMVRAVNAAGYSDYSNVLDVTTRDVAPAAPTNLRVDNVWARTIDLRWDDNSSNEAEFRVAISRDGGATWDNVAVLGASVTAFRVEGLRPNTRYLFRVRASNAEGYSDYSNILDVRTRP